MRGVGRKVVLCLVVAGAVAALAVCGEAKGLSGPVVDSGYGLSMTVGGVGLETERKGVLSISIPENVEEAYLYWGGRVFAEELDILQTCPYPDQTLLVTPPGGDETNLTGAVVGTLKYPEFNVTYMADVTEMVKAAGTGEKDFKIKDGDDCDLSRLCGAALLIIHTDDGDPGFYRIMIFEGVDYAWGIPDPPFQTTPVTFVYDPSAEDRVGDLLIVAGDAEDKRKDEIWVWWDPAQPPDVLYDELRSAKGLSLDPLFLEVDVPAGVGQTTVQLISPPDGTYEEEETIELADETFETVVITYYPDSLIWMVAALRIPVKPVDPTPGVAAIGDFVWEDLNRNGIQDEGEPGIEGVVVNLYDGDGAFVSQTTTDGDGYYEFTGLLPGDYYVEFVAPDGYAFTQPNQGDDDKVDSDADPVTGWTGVYTLAEGETNDTVDAGLYKLPKNPGTGTIGYWKTHPKAWPVESITVGGINYTKAQAISMMKRPPAGDMRWAMFPQLVAAMLNVEIGNDDSCIAGTIAAANAWWADYNGVNVRANSAAWKIGGPLHKTLDAYNNGRLCAPSRG